MAVPILDESISLLVFVKGEYVTYQPGATNVPTSWTCTGLPAGLAISGTTGKITGAATESGFFNCVLTATNGSGSDQFVLAIAIEAVTFNHDAFVEIDIDLATGAVSNRAVAVGGDAKETEPVILSKSGDWLLLAVGFTKEGRLVPLALAYLNLVLKEFEPENVLVLGPGSFETVGSYDDERYQIAVQMDPDTLGPVLSSYDDDFNTVVDCAAEFQWGLQHVLPGNEDPSVLEMTSQNFVQRVARDMGPAVD